MGSGLVIAIMLGPVFFVLIQTSIEKGFLTALIFSLGIVFSDSVFFFLAWLGISQIAGSALVDQLIGGIGGLILFGFGIHLMLKKPKKVEAHAIDSKGSLFRSFLKGFFVNSLNPSVLMYWLSVVGLVQNRFGHGPPIFGFFLGCMGMIFCTDL